MAVSLEKSAVRRAPDEASAAGSNGMIMKFDIRPSANPTSEKDRAAKLVDPGFGRVFTDHMAIVRYTQGKGWHGARVESRANFPLDPALAVLHYAQEIFEGLKAYKRDDGGVNLFRPDANARRFRSSAERMAMAPIPEETFIEAVEQVVRIDRACDQVVFLDAVERRYVEELGGMNVFFVFDDGSLLTPPLGTILPGITRDSIIALARDAGRSVREEAYTIDQWRADAASGKLKEAFACGTAAVISPIGKVRSASGDFVINGGVAGPVAMSLRKKLVDIQYGRAPDPHEWVRKVL